MNRTEIIPVEVSCKLDIRDLVPGSRPKQWMLGGIRERIAEAIMREVVFEECRDPYGSPMVRGRVFLARGFGDISANIREMEHIARTKIMQEQSWLEADKAALKVRESALKEAEANFRERFAQALSEFHGYDECAGRR